MPHWEDVRRRQIREFTAKHDARMVTWLRGTAKQLYEITEDKTPSAAARAFEDQVYDLLQKKISVTTLGKMLLNGLKRSVQYWIVPLDAENERARSGYAAQNKTPMSDYDNGEEFVATQMQNMYLADRGSQLFYLSYKRP